LRFESGKFCGWSSISLISAQKMINEANLSAVYEHDQKVLGSKVVAPPRTRKREQTERPIKGVEAPRLCAAEREEEG